MKNIKAVCASVLFFITGSVVVAHSAATMAAEAVYKPPRFTPPAEWETYRDDAVDLRAKVLGGEIDVTRTFFHRIWTLNSNWNNILFAPYNPIGGYTPSGPFIKQNDDLYLPDTAMPNMADSSLAVGQVVEWMFRVRKVEGVEFASKKRIVARLKKTSPAGGFSPITYRWEDGRGNWIEYEPVNGTGIATSFMAHVSAFGNRNNVRVTMAYDASDKRTGVFDHFGRQVFWYEYDALNRVNKVRDYAGREVRYDWQNGDFYDPLGNKWHYAFKADASQWNNHPYLQPGDSAYYDQMAYYETHANGLIDTKTSPEGRVLKFQYDISNSLKSIYDQDGVGYQQSIDYDKNKKEFRLVKKSAAGLVEEKWYDIRNVVFRRDISGETIFSLLQDKRVWVKKDRNGNETKDEFDEFGNLLKRTHPDGTTASYVYESKFNNITQETDENGVVTKYQYDDHGNQIRKTEAFGKPEQRVTEYTYDLYGQCTRVTILGDAKTLTAITTYEYDDRGNIVRVTYPEGGVDAYTRDVMGNILTRTDPRGKVWTNTYDLNGMLLTEADPLNHATTYQYDKVGRRVSQTDANIHTYLFEYSKQGWLTKQIDPAGATSLFEYNLDGHLLKATDAEGKYNSYEYDLSGRLAGMLDGNGNKISVAYPAESGLGYGGFSQAKKITYPTYEQQFKYDQRGRLLLSAVVINDVESVASRFVYDGLGNIVSVTDSNNKVSGYSYDALSRMVKFTNAMGAAALYGYDQRNNLIEVTNFNGAANRYTFDRNNWQISETHPLGETLTWTYDPMGNVLSRVDGKNQKITYEYDDAIRLVNERTYANSASASPIGTVTYSYDPTGKLLGWSDGSISVFASYDVANRLLSQSVNYGGFSLGHSYTYFRNGLKKTYTGPDSVTVSYAYDSANQIASLAIPGEGAVTINSYQWAAPKKVTLPGGSTRETTYNGLLKPQSVMLKDPAQNVLAQVQYSYGKMQELLTKHVDADSTTYTYDDVYQLVEATSTTRASESFTYDAQGNRTALNGLPGLSYNANDQLTVRPGFNYEYDANLNLSKKTDTQSGGQSNFKYDVLNRLTEVQDQSNAVIARYGYDPFGRRLWKEVSGTRTYFYYTGKGLAAEASADGTIQVVYGYWPNGMWGTDPVYVKVGGQYHYAQNDQLGTPFKLTNNTGVINWQAYRTSFGETILDSTNSLTYNQRFPGQYYDSETGLYYNWNRYYDPKTGRYISSDPIGLAGGLNSYLYVENDPANWIDPDGRFLQYIAAAAAVVTVVAVVKGIIKISEIIAQNTQNNIERQKNFDNFNKTNGAQGGDIMQQQREAIGGVKDATAAGAELTPIANKVISSAKNIGKSDQLVNKINSINQINNRNNPSCP